ncbi:hypothetical protein EYF80_010170 [Liparis tanakae]|uniref:Uncharacterized protein n=1 Tax=Liparis tanakae TaxID=230148 RepID=A0A4Z2IPJ5_9TELE|nr:hypothetical protein EYF80_010170 [Liparis tanakae]
MNILNYNKLNNKNCEPSKHHMMRWRRLSDWSWERLPSPDPETRSLEGQRGGEQRDGLCRPPLNGTHLASFAARRCGHMTEYCFQSFQPPVMTLLLILKPFTVIVSEESIRSARISVIGAVDY